MNYCFNVEDAVKYGVNEAVFLSNLRYWILFNQTHKKHFHDGHTWMYNSIQGFRKLFPFWSTSQLRLVIEHLLAAGVIIKGRYNVSAYDRTLWYAFAVEPAFAEPAAEAEPDLDLPEPAEAHLSEATRPHFPESENGIAGNDRPIPDINTDRKPDQKPLPGMDPPAGVEKKPRTESPPPANEHVRLRRLYSHLHALAQRVAPTWGSREAGMLSTLMKKANPQTIEAKLRVYYDPKKTFWFSKDQTRSLGHFIRHFDEIPLGAPARDPEVDGVLSPGTPISKTLREALKRRMP